uniref:BPI1 domain-containing protein n=1 Tax=Strongyloides venezuelensis TaxID=75913 RepID=A0A0K0FPC3_STRVS
MVVIFLDIQSLNIYIVGMIYSRNVNGNTIPGAQIQFSSVGLNYMAGVAIDYINSAIALSQIKIEEFNIPKSSNAFQFSSLDKLDINLQGISGKITSVDASVGISPLNGNPNISNSSCTANFNIFDIKLHGSLPDDMNDLFRKVIEKHFKEKIEIICQVIERVESDQDVELTGTFEGFYIDYALTSSPESSKTSFTIPIEDIIYYKGH